MVDGKFPFFFRRRNRAGFFLNKRFTCVAECLHRYVGMEDGFDNVAAATTDGIRMEFGAAAAARRRRDMLCNQSGAWMDLADGL